MQSKDEMKTLTKTPGLLTADLNALLSRYPGRAGNGRGRLVGNTRILEKMGYLKLTHTSHYCWVLTITEAGQMALLDYKEAS